MENTCDLMAFSYCALFKVTFFNIPFPLFYGNEITVFLEFVFVDLTNYMLGFRLEKHFKKGCYSLKNLC